MPRSRYMQKIGTWNGPNAPAALVLVGEARGRDLALLIDCACGHSARIGGATLLADRDTRRPIGELWLQGAFRCRCGQPASSVHVIDPVEPSGLRETWSLESRTAAERLRRHWRWYDRPSAEANIGMCNNYSFTRPVDAIAQVFRGYGQPVAFPEGLPNVAPNDDIRIGDTAPVVILDGETRQIVMRRFGWKGPTGKPVFNFRSEGRHFPAAQRCLVAADAFFEFTTPEAGGKGRKDRWRFELPEADWFWILAVHRDDGFAMLTTDPGPDVRPYHDRQIVVARSEHSAWLDPDPPKSYLGTPRTEEDFVVKAAPRER